MKEAEYAAANTLKEFEENVVREARVVEQIYPIPPNPEFAITDGPWFIRKPVVSVQGDPTIVGLRGQSLKFKGQGAAWYANLAAESLQWNMKFNKFSDCPKDEIIYVTGISIQIRKSRRLVHNVIIRLLEEDSFFPGCSEGYGSVCLGEGSFEIFVNGDTQRSPGDYYASTDNGDNGLRVIAHNTYGACTRMWYDYIIQQQGKTQSQESGNRRLLVSQETPLSLLSGGLG